MFDIIKYYDKVPMELVKKYSEFEESASIHEAMGRKGAMGGRIRPVWPGMRACGPAFTVEVRPGDNAILHKAIDMLQPGDVLVVSYSESTRTGGMWGGMMTASAKVKGCVGMVTDGAVRDTMLIRELNFPVFSAAINVEGTTKAFPGKINHAVNICGVTVNPGDLIFADNDDIVVVPKEIAKDIYQKTFLREKKEEMLLRRILNGEGTTYNLSGFDKIIDTFNLSEEE